jgi:hypothetical protein
LLTFLASIAPICVATGVTTCPPHFHTKHYIQTDFYKIITIWDFGISLAMKKIKNISNMLQLMNE